MCDKPSRLMFAGMDHRFSCPVSKGSQQGQCQCCPRRRHPSCADTSLQIAINPLCFKELGLLCHTRSSQCHQPHGSDSTILILGAHPTVSSQPDSAEITPKGRRASQTQPKIPKFEAGGSETPPCFVFCPIPAFEPGHERLLFPSECCCVETWNFSGIFH